MAYLTFFMELVVLFLLVLLLVGILGLGYGALVVVDNI
jgi:hypothetical protein